MSATAKDAKPERFPLVLSPAAPAWFQRVWQRDGRAAPVPAAMQRPS
jgi:hypothetical protein